MLVGACVWLFLWMARCLLNDLDRGNERYRLSPFALGVAVTVTGHDGFHAVFQVDAFALQWRLLCAYGKTAHFNVLGIFFVAYREIAAVVTLIDICDETS